MITFSNTLAERGIRRYVRHHNHHFCWQRDNWFYRFFFLRFQNVIPEDKSSFSTFDVKKTHWKKPNLKLVQCETFHFFFLFHSLSLSHFAMNKKKRNNAKQCNCFSQIFNFCCVVVEFRFVVVLDEISFSFASQHFYAGFRQDFNINWKLIETSPMSW